MPVAFGPNDEPIWWPVYGRKKVEQDETAAAEASETDPLAPMIPPNLSALLVAKSCERPGFPEGDDLSVMHEGLFCLNKENLQHFVVIVYSNGTGEELERFSSEEIYPNGPSPDPVIRKSQLERVRQQLAHGYGIEPDDIQLHEMPR